MRKIKIIYENKVATVTVYPDGTEYNPEIWCPMCGLNRNCRADCAWFRIGESNPYTESTTSAHGRTFAYCGDKLIGELEAAK